MRDWRLRSLREAKCVVWKCPFPYIILDRSWICSSKIRRINDFARTVHNEDLATCFSHGQDRSAKRLLPSSINHENILNQFECMFL